MSLDLNPLLLWATEREKIRSSKETGSPPPWTSDPILSRYRFCNVRREDDRVTIWVRENIRERYAGHQHLWFMLAIARWINWPATLDEMIMCPGAWPRAVFDWNVTTGLLKARQDRGDKVFTGAYTINAPQKAGQSKIDYVIRDVLGQLWVEGALRGDIKQFAKIAPSQRSMEGFHEFLRRFQGWGPFMAYQVVVDMRFTPGLLDRAKDRETWCAAGPGTIRGLNRLHGRPVTQHVSQAQACEECVKIYRAWPNMSDIKIDLSDVPNMLCETDKYLRVLNNQGAPRALYVPGRGC